MHTRVLEIDMKEIHTHERVILSLDEIPRSNGHKGLVTKSYSHKVNKCNPEIENENKLVQQIPKEKNKSRNRSYFRIGLQSSFRSMLESTLHIRFE